MPFCVEYQDDKRLICVRAHGVVTDEDYRRHLGNLYDVEKRASHSWYVLADVSQVEKFDVTLETIRKISEGNIRATTTRYHDVVIAVVAPGIVTHELAQLWGKNLEETGWRINIFTDSGEARAWLEKQQQLKNRSGFLPTTFLTRGNEKLFREAGLKNDARVVKGLMLLSVLFQIVALRTDLMLLGKTDELYRVWSIRGGSVVIGVVGILLLKRSKILSFDVIVFLWAVLLMGGIVIANFLLPASYTTHIAWDLFIVISVYTVVPLQLKQQIIAALPLTIGDVILFCKFKQLLWSISIADIIAAFVCANLVGIFASREKHIRRRMEFRAMRREAETREHLQKVWREIRTLRGIIPICANCKRVRTDEGSWRQVEAYVRDHTEADFSHGICPECSKKLYPELDKS